MIEAIVLDIGGVILRTSDRSGRHALDKKYGLPPGGTEDLVFNSQPAQDLPLERLLLKQSGHTSQMYYPFT
jgi:hypothetical protein